MFKKHILHILILISFFASILWFYCAVVPNIKNLEPCDYRLSPRLQRDGTVVNDTIWLNRPLNEKWWADAQNITDIDPGTIKWWGGMATEVESILILEEQEQKIALIEKSDPFWQELRDSVFKWMREYAEPKVPARNWYIKYEEVLDSDTTLFPKYRIYYPNRSDSGY